MSRAADLSCDTSAAQWDLFARVRDIKVHDTVNRVWVDATIGWWDRRGNTHCPECAPDGVENADVIDSGNSAAIGVDCDSCHRSLHEMALANHNPEENR